MILGGSENQLPLIIKSKELGYLVIVCDSRDEAPGVLLADIHKKINYSDYNGVLLAAKQEKIDGIITNSEPVVPIMSKIAEELGLVGNPLCGIQTLMSKTGFRDLQKSLGLFCPKSYLANAFSDIENELKELNYPIIIKPCECSGSRGTTKIESFNIDVIKDAFQICIKFSRNGFVTIEEFVEMYSLTTIEGEVFVYNDEILWDGLFSTTRASFAPMVPMTYSIPLRLSDERLDLIKTSITKIIKEAGIRFGELNIEGYFTKSYDFFVVEINVRQGGNHIPAFVKDNTGLDMSKLLVSLAVGDESYWEEVRLKRYVSKEGIRHIVFSNKTGIYDGILFDEEIKAYVISVEEKYKKGAPIPVCVNSTDAIAFVNIEFPSIEVCKKYYNKLENHIKVASH